MGNESSQRQAEPERPNTLADQMPKSDENTQRVQPTARTQRSDASKVHSREDLGPGRLQQPGSEFHSPEYSSNGRKGREGDIENLKPHNVDEGENVPSIWRMDSKLDSLFQRGFPGSIPNISHGNGRESSTKVRLGEPNPSISQANSPPAHDDTVACDGTIRFETPVRARDDCGVTSSDRATHHPGSAQSPTEDSDAPHVASCLEASKESLRKKSRDAVWPDSQSASKEVDVRNSNIGKLAAPSDHPDFPPRAECTDTGRPSAQQGVSRRRVHAGMGEGGDEVASTCGLNAPFPPRSEPKNDVIVPDVVAEHSNKGQVLHDKQDGLTKAFPNSSSTDLFLVSHSPPECVDFGKTHCDEYLARHVHRGQPDKLATEESSNPIKGGEILKPAEFVETGADSTTNFIAPSAHEGGDDALMDEKSAQDVKHERELEQAKFKSVQQLSEEYCQQAPPVMPSRSYSEQRATPTSKHQFRKDRTLQLIDKNLRELEQAKFKSVQQLSEENCQQAPRVMPSRSHNEQRATPTSNHQFSKDIACNSVPQVHERWPSQLTTKHDGEHLASDCATLCLTEDDDCRSVPQVDKRWIDNDGGYNCGDGTQKDAGWETTCPSSEHDIAKDAKCSEKYYEAGKNPSSDLTPQAQGTRQCHEYGDEPLDSESRVTSCLIDDNDSNMSGYGQESMAGRGAGGGECAPAEPGPADHSTARKAAGDTITFHWPQGLRDEHGGGDSTVHRPHAHPAGQESFQLSDKNGGGALTAVCVTSCATDADDDDGSCGNYGTRGGEGGPAAVVHAAMGADDPTKLPEADGRHCESSTPRIQTKKSTNLGDQRISTSRTGSCSITNYTLLDFSPGDRQETGMSADLSCLDRGPGRGDVSSLISENDTAKRSLDDENSLCHESSTIGTTRQESALLTGTNREYGSQECLSPLARSVHKPAQNLFETKRALDGQGNRCAPKSRKTRQRKNASGAENQQKGRKPESSSGPHPVSESVGVGKDRSDAAKTTRKQKSAERKGRTAVSDVSNGLEAKEGKLKKTKNQMHNGKKGESGDSRKLEDLHNAGKIGSPGSGISGHTKAGAKPKNQGNKQEPSCQKKQKQKTKKKALPDSVKVKQPGHNGALASDSAHQDEPAGAVSCKADSPTSGVGHGSYQNTERKAQSAKVQKSEGVKSGPSRWQRFVEFVQRRGAAVQETHHEKVEKITQRLAELQPKKKGKNAFVSLDAHEKRAQEEQPLQQRRKELEDQEREFNAFRDHFTQVYESGVHISKRCLETLQVNFERECARLENALPIYGHKTRIVEQVKQNQVSVVLGETGSGKSTQMVQYLYDAGFSADGVIVCTQPRKVAASSLCKHVATEIRAKHLVGCRVGAQSPRNTAAKILYTTDHSLLNECLKDPSLRKYSCIIIDEAHERSIYTDLLLGMIKKALQTRPELRVVITSATIDPDLFVSYFSGCPVLRVSGRMFPVDVLYRERKEDYVNDAVGVSYEIHTTQEADGDILVFLTSPAEVERACEKLQAKCGEGRDLQCLPLHGKLRQQDQMKVFQSYPGIRKVIFATNCAETSVTVPGVKYVVDTGKVKEMRFDAKRNMSSLVVTDVNKSSAEQRKGRAGRTQAGKCYRLYSQQDYEGMNDQSAPEILRIHLGQAILKLMELGVPDPAEFDFVESPPKESLRSAMETLAALGAVREKRLTERGHKMARLPLEPRLAKLVLQGMDEGVGSEALILAAVATVNGSIFFRMGSEEEKKLADTRKVQFCQEGGDLLTLLAAYREWSAVGRRNRNRWCFENSLNAKALRIAEDTVKELTLVLKHELKIDVQDATAEDLSPRGDTLRKILLSCYIENLCMFTGHERAGYLAATLDQCVTLHPSSALKVLNFNPRFAVYGQVLKTSREFLLNVTPVDEEWLEDVIRESGLAIDLRGLEAAVLESEKFSCSGELMNIFLARRGFRQLRNIEEELSRIANVDSPVVLEADKTASCLTSFARASCKAHVRADLERRLEKGREQLRAETKEVPILEGRTTTRAAVGKGGEVQHLLMPSVHLAVVIRNVPMEIPLTDVLEELKTHGPVQSHTIFDDQRKVIVTYANPEAVAALLQVKDELPYRVTIHQPGQNGDIWKCGLKAKLTWCRRPSTGTAQVSFKYHEDDITEVIFNLRGKVLRVKERLVPFGPDKFHPARLFLRNLGSNATESDVQSALESACPGVSVDKVFLHRKIEFETTQRELLKLKTMIKMSVETYVDMGDFEVDLLPPKTPKAVTYLAFLHFEDAVYGRKALETLERVGLWLDAGKVTITPQLRCTLRCQRNVFSLLQTNVESIKEECLKRCQTECDRKALAVTIRSSDQGVFLVVKSECIKHYVEVTGAIRSEIDADVIDCSRNERLGVLLTAGGKEALRRVQEKTGALIYPDGRSRSIKVFGKMESKEAAKIEINAVLEELFVTDSELYEIALRAPNRPRGLLKAVVSRHGVDLAGLQRLEGVQGVSLDLRRQMLKVTCSKDGFAAVEAAVAECAEALPGEPASAEQPGEVECMICYETLDDGASYRVACCGHAYCPECVENKIKVSVNDKQFPLTCDSEGCSESFVWKDFEKTAKDPKALRSLVEASIDHYTTSNPDKVKHCLTPDCGAIYAVSSDGRPFTCYGCQTEICTTCHVQYHQGLTCAMYQSEKKDSGSVTEYLEQNKNTKRCPKCRVLIEKIEGCNHMTCKMCRAHMCWRCLKVFLSGGEVYAHQSKCLVPA